MTKKEIIKMLAEEAKNYGSFSEFAGELGWDERWMPDYAEKLLTYLVYKTLLKAYDNIHYNNSIN